MQKSKRALSLVVLSLALATGIFSPAPAPALIGAEGIHCC